MDCVLFCEQHSPLPQSCLLLISTMRLRCLLDDRRQDTKRRQTNINVAAYICIASDFRQTEVTTIIGISNASLINFYVFMASLSLLHCRIASAYSLRDGLRAVTLEWLSSFLASVGYRFLLLLVPG